MRAASNQAGHRGLNLNRVDDFMRWIFACRAPLGNHAMDGSWANVRSEAARFSAAFCYHPTVNAAAVQSTCCGILIPRGPVGAGERLILLDALSIMLLIVVPVIAATFYFAWKYRASNTKARYRPEWAYSGRLEFIVWGIPGLVILFLGGIAWIGAHDLDPARPLSSKAAPLEIQVVSLDWKWLFIYPQQGIATVNELTVPVGVPVHFSLTSATVLNAFFVPQLGSQIYTMAGMVTQLYLQADQLGSYPGLSSHFSGDGFSDMHFDVSAVSAPQFTAWVRDAHTGSDDLNLTAYAQLAKPSVNTSPRTYAGVAPALFERIVRQAPLTAALPAITAPLDH
jgi:cytochrome o ubiquinol oxidase subunit II